MYLWRTSAEVSNQPGPRGKGPSYHPLAEGGSQVWDAAQEISAESNKRGALGIDLGSWRWERGVYVEGRGDWVQDVVGSVPFRGLLMLPCDGAGCATSSRIQLVPSLAWAMQAIGYWGWPWGVLEGPAEQHLRSGFVYKRQGHILDKTHPPNFGPIHPTFDPPRSPPSYNSVGSISCEPIEANALSRVKLLGIPKG